MVGAMARKKLVPVPVAAKSTMRRFTLVRTEDVSGVSGTGPVVEGIQFSNGEVVLRWTTALSSIGIYNCIETVLKIHGHDGRMEIEWFDP